MMRVALPLLLAATQLGCASWRGLPPRIADCPGELVSTEALGDDFVARERYRVTRADESLRVDLVIQKRGDQLVLLGFDPLGAKLFQIVQRGTSTEVEAMPRAVVGVPPLNVLRDVHRARFGAATDARVSACAAVVLIENPRCATESTLERVSEQALP